MESDKLIRPYKYAARYTTATTMLIFSAVIILFVGLALLALTIWSFTWKLVAYRYFLDLKMDTTFLALPGGLLTIPCVFLTVLLKHNKFKHMILFLIIKIIAIAILSTGYFLGMQYQLHYANETTRLSHTIPTIPLNHTLHSIIASYEESPENTTALDKLQRTFTCCGVQGTGDFVEVPTSCCNMNDCETHGYYGRGCLRTIQEDVAWQNNITLSVSQLFLLMFIFNAAMVISVYISDRNKWRAFDRNKIEQNR